jgi:hypothetical protein
MQYKGQHPPLLPKMPFCLLYLLPKLALTTQDMKFTHPYQIISKEDCGQYYKEKKKWYYGDFPCSYPCRTIENFRLKYEI